MSSDNPLRDSIEADIEIDRLTSELLRQRKSGVSEDDLDLIRDQIEVKKREALVALKRYHDVGYERMELQRQFFAIVEKFLDGEGGEKYPIGEASALERRIEEFTIKLDEWRRTAPRLDHNFYFNVMSVKER